MVAPLPAEMYCHRFFFALVNQIDIAITLSLNRRGMDALHLSMHDRLTI